jgi:acyl-homoserine lactone acylase PvdQ
MLQRPSNLHAAILGLAAVCIAALALNGRAQSSSLNDLASRALARIDGEVKVPGLQADVRIVRDTWGVPHIYAKSDADLFLAQGYVAAQDRLWQMEMWRRTAEGRLAEVLGPQAVGRDKTARLLKYRGRFDAEEFESYHPDAKRLMTAYVAGVNAFIASHGDRLAVEFVLTGIRPEPWLSRRCSFDRSRSGTQPASCSWPGKLPLSVSTPRTAGAIPIRGTTSLFRTVSTWRALAMMC